MRCPAISIALAALLLSCQRETEQGEILRSIASLRDIATNSHSVLVTDNITLRGTITANDAYGELHNAIIMEDHSAAVKILCDIEDNFETFPINHSLTIHCSGLYLDSSFGGLTLGSTPTPEYTLGYIPLLQLGLYAKVNGAAAEPLEPEIINLNSLSPLHIFRLVEIHNVVISNDQGVSTFCSRDPITGRTQNTTHNIQDENGDNATLSVSRHCRYADRELPVDKVNIRATVEYFDSEYRLVLNNAGFEQSDR